MSDKKKIKLLVIPEMFPAHDEDIAGVYTLDYIRAVQPFCDVEVFYPRLSGEPGLQSEDDVRGFRIHRFHLMNGDGGWLRKVHYVRWFTRALTEAKKLGPFDLIHAHGPLLHGNLAVQLGQYFKIPVILSVHTGPFSVISRNPFYSRMAARSIAKANLTLAVSEHLQQEIADADMKPKRMAVSGNPVNEERFQWADRSEQRQLMVFVSRLDEFKGGLRTLKAFHKAMPTLPGWRLAIAGVGKELEKIERYVALHGLEKSVRITGTLTKESLHLLFIGGDFLVFPSRHETFGLIAQEALVTGMPVIAGNTTALDECIDDTMGIKVDPDDVDQIAEAMVQLAQNPEQFDGREIRKKVVERFGLEAFGRQMKTHYEALLAECAELQE